MPLWTRVTLCDAGCLSWNWSYNTTNRSGVSFLVYVFRVRLPEATERPLCPPARSATPEGTSETRRCFRLSMTRRAIARFVGQAHMQHLLVLRHAAFALWQVFEHCSFPPFSSSPSSPTRFFQRAPLTADPMRTLATLAAPVAIQVKGVERYGRSRVTHATSARRDLGVVTRMFRRARSATKGGTSS